ncbi:NADH-cytochrome b5 reductase-like isoform X2 [Ambystoma mexicanum]|uniref:NADH-cytochrome b5 reductase-like isoform X2 n=1 Tax=Ambystoma mexicanum TaxID=8296 RepID=UPI0037E74A30
MDLFQEMDESSDDWLSLKPVQPLPSQCCGSGCTPCIFDIYQKELALWEEAKKRNDKNYLTNKETNKKDSNAAIIDSEMFTAFKLCSVERLTDDTCQYRFELPRGWTLGLTLGQHIVLRGTVNDMELQRAYTPISPVDMEDSFEVLIKCYPDGLMSQYVQSWKVNDSICWRGPFGGFPYEPNKYGQLLMLASGTGVAPMLPIMQHITGNEDDETFVTLVGCFRNFKSIYMKPLLQDLSLYWNIKTVYALSQEETIDNLPWSYQEKTHIGRIDCDVLRSVIDSCRRKPYVLICGSLTFNEDMVNYLKRLELQEDSCFIF